MRLGIIKSAAMPRRVGKGGPIASIGARLQAASAHPTAYLWHTGQKNVDRPLCTIRLTTPSHPCVTQGLPSRS
jgi:hypothetical protein